MGILFIQIMKLTCMKTNLMRRLSGLLYLDNKTMGDIKEKMKKKLNYNDLYCKR